MQRVLILGSSGSGKSTFARKLGGDAETSAFLEAVQTQRSAS
jgi:adenylate kinase family enzyme